MNQLKRFITTITFLQLLKVIEPPSRQSNDYFYYRPDSPHYEDNINHHDDLSTSASNRNFEYERKVDDFAIEDLGRRFDELSFDCVYLKNQHVFNSVATLNLF